MEPVQDAARRPFGCLNEINVFRVPCGRLQEQFVECGPSAEGKLCAEKIIRENLDTGTTHDQVLLDLAIICPRRVFSPFCDEILRDQCSHSTSSLTRILHRAFRGSCTLGREGASNA